MNLRQRTNKNDTGLKIFKPKKNLNHSIYNVYAVVNFTLGSILIFLCFDNNNDNDNNNDIKVLALGIFVVSEYLPKNVSLSILMSNFKIQNFRSIS